MRVYGAKDNPYKLPAFLTPRIFSLEVLRQRFNSYFIHFASKNQAASFKLPIIVGPFTVKSKAVVKIIDEMLVCFNFEEDEAFQYDPCQIISNKRKKLKRGSYEHKGTHEMKELANKIIFSSKEVEDLEDSEQTELEDTKIKITNLVIVEDLEKIPHDEDVVEVDT